VTCLTCTHWALKGSPLAVHGFGLCKQEPPPFNKARMHSAGDNCPKHKRINDEQIDKRREWLRKTAAVG